MHTLSHGLVALIVGGLLLRCQAWVLDDSCKKDKGVEEIIKDAMTGAFEMAAAGVKAIHARPSGSDNDNLYKWLFGDAPTESEATDILSNIELAGDFEKQSNDQMNKLDVKLYCDFSRFTEYAVPPNNHRPEMPKAYDNDVGLYVDMDATYSNCKNSLAMGKDQYIHAYTIHNNPNHIAQIQICRWYLNKVRLTQYKSWRGIRPKSVLFTIFDAWHTRQGENTRMDVAALFDHTLLHELSHATPFFNTKDVGASLFDSYGWKNCVENFAQNHQRGFENADSIAYFCLGAKMIADGQIPQRDGTVKSTTAPPAAQQPAPAPQQAGADAQPAAQPPAAPPGRRSITAEWNA